MDEKTREALEGSIRKWESIVDGTGVDKGADNCPLCIMFILEVSPNDDDDYDAYCNGCPVKDKTGKSECKDTPFYRWRDLVGESQDGRYRAITEEQKVAAEEELEFLKSLRPSQRPTEAN